MKSKKLFGVFNIVDIILILAVIVVGAVGAKMFLGGGSTDTAAETKTYSYVVMGQEVLDETADFPVVGGNAYNSSTSAYLGTVKEVATEQFTETVYDKDTSKFHKVPVEGYSNIYVTIEGSETEKDITVNGTTVKTGMELNVKGKGYAFKGIVVEVRDGE